MFELDNDVLLEKLAEQFTDEELQDIVDEEGVEVETEEVETEKTASEYYELGQIMAIGFQDQLEKEAMPAKLKGAYEAVRGAGKALAGGYRGARAGKHLKGMKKLKAAESAAKGAPAVGRLESAKAALKGLSGAQRKALGGAAAAGAAGAGAAGLAAHQMMKKKSYDEGIYDTLEYLNLLEEE